MPALPANLQSCLDKLLPGDQVVGGEAKPFENGPKRPGREVAWVPGNDCRSILVRVVPDLMASLALALQLATEPAELPGQLSICHAGTRTETRPGAVTVSMPGGSCWFVSTMTAIRSCARSGASLRTSWTVSPCTTSPGRSGLVPRYGPSGKCSISRVILYIAVKSPGLEATASAPWWRDFTMLLPGCGMTG